MDTEKEPRSNEIETPQEISTKAVASDQPDQPELQEQPYQQPEDIEVETEIDVLRKDLAQEKDKYIRLFAEFDNFRKRTAKEKIEWIQRANQELVTALLDVLDDCDRAEKHLENDATPVENGADGVRLVFNKIRSVLHNKGLRPMENTVNTVFDLDKHEAVLQQPAPTEEQKDKILEELQKGYYWNEMLIRHAKVVVGQ